MAVLSAVSEWDHYLCSGCSTMSALRPGMSRLTVIDPLSRWTSPAFSLDDRSTDVDAPAAGVGPVLAEVSAPTSFTPEPAPVPAVPLVSARVSDIETPAPPTGAAVAEPEPVPMSTRMRELVVQAERTDNPWGI